MGLLRVIHEKLKLSSVHVGSLFSKHGTGPTGWGVVERKKQENCYFYLLRLTHQPHTTKPVHDSSQTSAMHLIPLNIAGGKWSVKIPHPLSKVENGTRSMRTTGVFKVLQAKEPRGMCYMSRRFIHSKLGHVTYCDKYLVIILISH